ncbi:MAG: hypothetical protein QOH57_3159 [Mycobacterium sp.]|nr:hypothetical protein [Mycobacterium sp.]
MQVAIGVGFVCALLIALQIVALSYGFQGPLWSLASDYVATPKAPEVLWAGLGLASVGLTKRRRVVALSVAAGIDVLFLAGRALTGSQLAIGNGPLIVLTCLAFVAWRRWTGTERRNAAGSIALGALLIIAIKVGYGWLDVTAIACPKVLDEYVMLADYAFGQPSWLFGRMMQASGPVPPFVFHTVYNSLSVAAMAVAVYQLRNVTRAPWPRHYVVRTFLLLGLIGPVIYVIFPVVGPAYAFGADGEGFQLGNFWPHILPPLDWAPGVLRFDEETPRNCMPSMHTAWATAVFIHSRRGPGWLRWGGAFWLFGTLTATLGFGYHYAVDLVVGAVLCLAVESMLRDPDRGWDRIRVALVGGGAVLLTALLLGFRYLAVPMAHLPFIFGPLMLALLAAYAFAFYAVFFRRRLLVVSRQDI